MKTRIALIALAIAGLSASALDTEKIDRSWLYGTEKEREPYARILNKPIPKDFALTDPINAKEITGTSIAGRYTVIDVWATWCGPCVASIPKNNQLYAKYRDQINFIGVCAEDGSDDLPKMAKKRKISYPVGIDKGGKLEEALKVQAYPCYHLIDPEGNLVVADIETDHVEDVIKLVVNKATTETTAPPIRKK